VRHDSAAPSGARKQSAMTTEDQPRRLMPSFKPRQRLRVLKAIKETFQIRHSFSEVSVCECGPLPKSADSHSVATSSSTYRPWIINGTFSAANSD